MNLKLLHNACDKCVTKKASHKTISQEESFSWRKNRQQLFHFAGFVDFYARSDCISKVYILVGFWGNLVRIFVRYWCTKQCEALTKFKISFVCLPGAWQPQKYFVLSNLKTDFHGNQNKYRKASQRFLAYCLLTETFQFVWMSAVTRRLVIQLNN